MPRVKEMPRDDEIEMHTREIDRLTCHGEGGGGGHREEERVPYRKEE